MEILGFAALLLYISLSIDTGVMAARRGGSRPARRIGAFRSPGLILAGSLVLAACTTSSPSQAEATRIAQPTESATPEPTPVDLAATFVSTISDPDLTMRLDLSGDVQAGPMGGLISGSAQITPTSYEQEITVAIAGTEVTGAWSHVAGHDFELVGGQWFEQTATGSGSQFDLRTWLVSLDNLHDAGEATYGDRRLHRLVADDMSVPAQAFVTDPGFQRGTAEGELWADGDGTPAAIVFHVRWTQAVADAGNIDLDATYAFDVTSIDTRVIVQRPEVIWAWTSFPHRFVIGHPKGWSEQLEGDSPSITAPDGTILIVEGGKLRAGITPNEAQDEVVRHLQQLLGMPVERVEQITVAGQPARLMVFPSQDGETYMAAVFVNGRQVYLVEWLEFIRPSRESQGIFESLLATARFDG